MPQEIKEDIFFIGIRDWDRRLFDELIPLPDGTSYNAYLVKGSEKIALIDTVDPTKKEALINQLKTLNLSELDFVISQHAEQDHSGVLLGSLKILNIEFYGRMNVHLLLDQTSLYLAL